MMAKKKGENNTKLDLSGIVTIFSILIVLVAVVFKLVASGEQVSSPVTEITEMPQAGSNIMMADVIASIKQQIASVECSHAEGSNEYVLSGLAHTSSVTIIAATTDIDYCLRGITLECELQTVEEEENSGALNEMHVVSLTDYQDYRAEMSVTYNAIISAMLQYQNPESALIAQEIDNAVLDDSVVNHAMSSLRYTIYADKDAEILYATFIIID